MRSLYLDYNATTPVAPSVLEAMEPFFCEHYGNPSSSHALGRACQEAVQDARAQVAALLDADRDEIVFTSGGTESNNLAIKGVMMQQFDSPKGHLIISAIEHPATVQPARFLQKLGYGLTVVRCNPHGVVDPEDVRAALRPETRLISIMHANNETGAIQPIREIAEIAHAHGALCHTDAAQSAGKISTSIEELAVDLLSVAGHKMYAPKGVGALYVRRQVRLDPVLHGAGHEGGLRAGTENTPYLAGLGKAALMAWKNLPDSGERLTELRDRLQARLQQALGEKFTVNSDKALRLPNTLSANFLGVSGGELLARIPELCASTGSACHSGAVSMSPTLEAMELDPEHARGTVRLSLGWHTSEEELERAAELLIGAWEALTQ